MCTGISSRTYEDVGMQIQNKHESVCVYVCEILFAGDGQRVCLCVCTHTLFSSQETCNLKRWDGGISSPHAVAGDKDT